MKDTSCDTPDWSAANEANPASVPALIAAFPPPEFYLDEVSVRRAIDRRDMFNLLQPDTGDKIDFWMLTEEESGPRTTARPARRFTWTCL